MSKLYLVHDTNFFLHFKNLDEIDWKNALGESFTEIDCLILEPVLNEIENHKFSERKKIRDRASKISKLLEPYLLQTKLGPMKNNINLSFYEPDEKFEKLDTQNVDDQILHYLKYIKSGLTSGQHLIVVTHDIGLKLKLKKYDIRFIDLDEKYKLPLEKTKEHVELERVNKELLKLKNRMPKLKLSLEDNKAYTEFALKKHSGLNSEELKEKLEKIKREVPLRSNNDSNILRAFENINFQFNKISEDEWDRYNEKVDNYYKRYEKYLVELDNHKSFQNRFLCLELELSNIGTSPGTNVDIHLHITVSQDVKLLSNYEYDELIEQVEPTEPSAPQKPQSLLESMSSFGRFNDSLYIPRNIGPNDIIREPENVTGPKITPTNSYNVEITVRNIKHLSNVKLDAMYLLFPDNNYSESFKIEYSIICDEIPEPHVGEINFKNNTLTQ